VDEVKIFTRGADESDGNPEPFIKLQKAINDWLKENPKIEIIGRNVATCTGVNVLAQPFINCTVVIFFRRKV
jgi:hypothetical protein